MNNYSENILQQVRQYLGLDEDDTSRDDEINGWSPQEIFSIVCQWEGFMGSYDTIILGGIKDIFKVDLTGEKEIFSVKKV